MMMMKLFYFSMILVATLLMTKSVWSWSHFGSLPRMHFSLSSNKKNNNNNEIKNENKGIPVDDYRQGVTQFNEDVIKQQKTIDDELEEEAIDRELSVEFFADLTGGKDSLTVKQFFDWEEMNELVASGATTTEDILEALQRVGVKTNSIGDTKTVMNFEQFYATLREVNESYMASDYVDELDMNLDLSQLMERFGSGFENEGEEEEDEEAGGDSELPRRPLL